MIPSPIWPRKVVRTLLVLMLAIAPILTQAATIYVDQSATGNQDGTSWVDAYSNLRLAMLAANPGDEIWVTNDLYLPTTNGERDSTFNLRDSVDMYGGFLGTETSIGQRIPTNYTILSGNIGDPMDSVDNSKHVCWVSSWFVEMTLDGFILEDGQAETSSGSAVYTHEGYITFVNCIFRNNFSLYGGAICASVSHLKYYDCVFENNRGIWGGAWQGWGGTDDFFYNCTFTNNHSVALGGAVTAQLQTDVRMENCRFYGNWSRKGGAIATESDGKVVCINCILDGNLADSGAALANVDSGRIEIYHGAIVQNHANNLGGAIYNHQGTAVILNSIIVDNTASMGPANLAGMAAQVEVKHALSDEALPGPGNMVAVPNFVDADGADNVAGTPDDDLHIASNSVCVNSGNATMVPPDMHDANGNGDMAEAFPFDLDEQARITGMAPDIGPYERGDPMGVANLAPNGISLNAVYPNPTRGPFTITLFVSSPQAVLVSVLDLQGKKLKSLYKGTLPTGKTRLDVASADLAEGVYLIRIVSGDTILTRKLAVLAP